MSITLTSPPEHVKIKTIDPLPNAPYRDVISIINPSFKSKISTLYIILFMIIKIQFNAISTQRFCTLIFWHVRLTRKLMLTA